MPEGGEVKRSFLFLQGPLSPLYRLLGKALSDQGCRVLRVNVCVGDWLHWHGAECLSYRGKKENWSDYLRQLISQHGITTLILHSDSRWYHQQAVNLAREAGLEVIVTELGLLRPGWLTLEWGGLGGNSDFPSDPDELLLAPRPDPASVKITDHGSFAQMALWDVTYNLLNYFLWFLYPHFTRHTPYNPLREYLAWLPRLLSEKRRYKSAAMTTTTLIESKAHYFLFPLQLSGDFQIRSHSPYDTMHQAITDVLQSFAAKAPAPIQLVIKQHPLDPGLDRLAQWVAEESSRLGITSRVHYLDGGNLNLLMKNSLGVVTVNSTAGMEALQLLKPVKVLGCAIYNMKKLTDQQSLNQFWTEPKSPDQIYVEALIRSLIKENQVRGSLYGQQGLGVAVEGMAGRIVRRNSKR